MITFNPALFCSFIIAAIECNIVQCRSRDPHEAYSVEQLQKTYGRTSDRHLFLDNIRLQKNNEPKLKENYATKEEGQEDHEPREQELYRSVVPDTPEDPVETQISTRNVELKETDPDKLLNSRLPRKRKTAKQKPRNSYSVDNVVKVEDSATYEEFAANYLKQLQDLGTNIETDFGPSNYIPDPRTHVFRNTPNKHGQATFHSIQDIINSADDPNIYLYANHNYNLEPNIVDTNSVNPGEGSRLNRKQKKRPVSVNSFQPKKPVTSSVKLVNTRNANNIRCSGSSCSRRPVVNGKRLVSGRGPHRGTRRRRPNLILTRTNL